jgi:hypothetical protein
VSVCARVVVSVCRLSVFVHVQTRRCVSVRLQPMATTNRVIERSQIPVPSVRCGVCVCARGVYAVDLISDPVCPWMCVCACVWVCGGCRYVSTIRPLSPSVMCVCVVRACGVYCVEHLRPRPVRVVCAFDCVCVCGVCVSNISDPLSLFRCVCVSNIFRPALQYVLWSSSGRWRYNTSDIKHQRLCYMSTHNATHTHMLRTSAEQQMRMQRAANNRVFELYNCPCALP